MAIDILFGSLIGFTAMGIVWWMKAHEARGTYREQQEKDYIEVQHKVDEIVTILERMVYRPRP
jgi:hypothetical protein